MLYIVKKDNNKMQLLTEDRRLLSHIHDSFSVRELGYQYTSLFKSGRSDGYTRYLNLTDSTMGIGLLYELVKYLRKFDMPFVIVEDEDNPPLFTKFTGLDEFVDTFTETFIKHPDISPYEYQNEAFKQVLRDNRSILLSPTGSGKSLIVYMIICYLLTHTDGNILIIVPFADLKQQYINDFYDYSRDDNLLGLISTHKNDNNRITIETWQSIQHIKNNPEWFNQFTSLLYDEVHTAQAKVISKIIRKFKNTTVRIGLTGTIGKCKTHILTLQSLFGRVRKTKKTYELIQDGVLSKVLIIAKNLKWNFITSENLEYNEELESVLYCKERSDIILDDMGKFNNNTICLFSRISHGQYLYNKAKDMYGKTNSIYYIDGSTPLVERGAILDKVRASDNSLLIASYGVMSTGVNVKNIFYIQLASPTKSFVRLMQSIGRGLRLYKNKKELVVIDYGDTGHRTTNNFLGKHMKERLKMYNEEKFPYKVVTKKLGKVK